MTDRHGKYLVFCSGAEHMSEMKERVPEWFGKIDSDPHVYTAYSDDPLTSKAFADFKADESEHLKLLFCIDMLNEGIHVDNVSGVILLRPTVSPIVFKQQIGRALSEAETYFKEHGDLSVLKTYVSENGFRLGEWVSNKRKQNKNGKLPPERIRSLDRIGIRW